MLSRVSTAIFATSLLACLMAGSVNALAQRRARPGATPTQQVAAMPKGSAGSQNFDTIAAAATAAREADKIDEAIGLYRQAIALRPTWAEGWWFLGTLYYDHDQYAEAAKAFKQTAQIQQKVGAPWAMLGLCEYQLARYDDARGHFEQARTLGLGDNIPMSTANLQDGFVALKDGQMVLLRIPYPMGFYAKGFDGRIDDPNAGWKGRGLWSTNGDRTPWLMEGGKGSRPRAVHIQLRPDPLAK